MRFDELNSEPCGFRGRPGRRHARRGAEGHRRGHHHGRRPGRGRGGRAGRGDLRHVILMLLGSEPMHGYQIITTIGEKTEGNWTPSPGTIYPTLSMLEDEGLISISHEMGRKMARLTDEGAQEVAQNKEAWGKILEAYRNPESREVQVFNIRTEFHQLREVVKAAPEDKSEQIIEILRRTADDIKKL
ncbi:putative transcriptional regulator [Corynebacterium suranareeae]|uniref:Putative transcriptional regulator n=1 Tax=Corynebacterium suranareeae TaxID=2506452 RepID=A0A169S9R8_9CORY|nr:PadR family transcriptional regulator [Corynebacterium suranareeae]BAU97322.1 putative transcriptional regulator [Corynebacterium suranareeae]